MVIHADEMECARAYEKQLVFEGLTQQQTNLIMERGRALYKWMKRHEGFHNLLNLCVLAFIFAADWWALMRLPEWIIGPEPGTARIVAGAAAAGALHSYLLYTLGVFSMHEGAAHGLIFLGSGGIAKAANFVASNLCRIMGADPIYYAPTHMAHHARFGLEGDAEFLNFVKPRRYWPTFLPFAAVINYTDFLIHRAPNYTWSRVVSAVMSLAYQLPYAYLCYEKYGGLFAAVCFLGVMPHFGFYLDRLRQFTEHNLLPLDNKNGSRNFGFGFWGLLVGGGPWGSPCHWSHHLVASIPWYQQLILHRYIAGLLTRAQKKQFLIEPVIGFPRLWWRLVRELSRFPRRRSVEAR